MHIILTLLNLFLEERLVRTCVLCVWPAFGLGGAQTTTPLRLWLLRPRLFNTHCALSLAVLFVARVLDYM